MSAAARWYTPPGVSGRYQSSSTGAGAGSASGVTPGSVEAEFQRLRELESFETEAGRRSLPANLLTSAMFAMLMLLPLMPGATLVFGQVTLRESVVIAGSGWLLYELATLCFHLRGPQHALTRFSAVFDDAGRFVTLFALIYCTHSSVSVLWLWSLARSFRSGRQTARQHRTSLVVVTVTHLGLALAFLRAEQGGDATLVGLMLIAAIVASTAASRTWVSSLRVRAERNLLQQAVNATEVTRDRERIARELHDGVGADVMALVLLLRRAGERNPAAARLAQQAHGILGDLRKVVWSLRDEQGTLGELGKLIDARCFELCTGVTYQRSIAPADMRRRIGPGTALTVLNVAQELVRVAVVQHQATRVHISLSSDTTVALQLEAACGQAPLSQWLAETDTVRAWLNAPLGEQLTLDPNADGLRARVELALGGDSAEQPLR